MNDIIFIVIVYFLIGFVWANFVLNHYYVFNQRFGFVLETINFGINLFLFPVGVLRSTATFFEVQEENLFKLTLYMDKSIFELQPETKGLKDPEVQDKIFNKMRFPE
jgi:hypothetical protein